jgi:Flp pilus assembly pilin Flp
MLRFFIFTQNFLAGWLGRDRGAAAVEYGLLVTLISVAIVLALFRLSLRINFAFLRVTLAL